MEPLPPPPQSFFLPSSYLWLRQFSPRLVSSRPRCRSVFVPFVFWHNWPDQQPAQRRFLPACLPPSRSFFYLQRFLIPCSAPLHCLILLLSILCYLVSLCLRVFDFVFASFFWLWLWQPVLTLFFCVFLLFCPCRKVIMFPLLCRYHNSRPNMIYHKNEDFKFDCLGICRRSLL